MLAGVEDDNVATPPESESEKSAASKVDGLAISLKTDSEKVTVIWLFVEFIEEPVIVGIDSSKATH